MLLANVAGTSLPETVVSHGRPATQWAAMGAAASWARKRAVSTTRLSVLCRWASLNQLQCKIFKPRCQPCQPQPAQTGRLPHLSPSPVTRSNCQKSISRWMQTGSLVWRHRWERLLLNILTAILNIHTAGAQAHQPHPHASGIAPNLQRQTPQHHTLQQPGTAWGAIQATPLGAHAQHRSVWGPSTSSTGISTAPLPHDPQAQRPTFLQVHPTQYPKPKYEQPPEVLPAAYAQASGRPYAHGTIMSTAAIPPTDPRPLPYPRLDWAMDTVENTGVGCHSGHGGIPPVPWAVGPMSPSQQDQHGQYHAGQFESLAPDVMSMGSQHRTVQAPHSWTGPTGLHQEGMPLQHMG